MFTTASPRVYWLRTIDKQLKVEVIEPEVRYPLRMCPFGMHYHPQEMYSLEPMSAGLRALSRAILWDATGDKSVVDGYWLEFADEALPWDQPEIETAVTADLVIVWLTRARALNIAKTRSWVSEREGTK